MIIKDNRQNIINHYLFFDKDLYFKYNSFTVPQIRKYEKKLRKQNYYKHELNNTKRLNGKLKRNTRKHLRIKLMI